MKLFHFGTGSGRLLLSFSSVHAQFVPILLCQVLMLMRWPVLSRTATSRSGLCVAWRCVAFRSVSGLFCFEARFFKPLLTSFSRFFKDGATCPVQASRAQIPKRQPVYEHTLLSTYYTLIDPYRRQHSPTIFHQPASAHRPIKPRCLQPQTLRQ